MVDSALFSTAWDYFSITGGLGEGRFLWENLLLGKIRGFRGQKWLFKSLEMGYIVGRE
jgi:hypothetical protein